MSKTKLCIYGIMSLLLGLTLVAHAEVVSIDPTPSPSSSSSFVDAPTNLQATAGYRYVLLTWSPSSAFVRYYRVEASSDGGKKWYAGPVTRGNYYKLQNPSKKILIMYRIIAVGKIELSLPSNTATFIFNK